MNINNHKSFWLPSSSYNTENNTPKFLYRVDTKIPEEVFQHGFNIDDANFNFFDYFFNYSCINNNESRSVLNAYETIQEALLHFRKDLNLFNKEVKDLYLYVIRADEIFYSKEITRNSIATAIIDKRLKVKDDLVDKILFSFNDFGQKFTNILEWFTVQKISSEQIFSASQIKINFRRIDNSKKLNSWIATPTIINLEFRNPNYIEFNTNANERAFWFPEPNAPKEIEYKNFVYYAQDIFSYDIANIKEPYIKSFRCDNISHTSKKPNKFFDEYISKKTIVKKFYFVNEKNKKKEIVVNFNEENIDILYQKLLLKNSKSLNYYQKPKRFKLFFSYEKNSSKSVFLNTSVTNKKSVVYFEPKTNKTKNIKKVNFDKRGRIIFHFDQVDSIPLALTLSNYDKSNDIVDVETYPAVINEINQCFHLEHAYSGIFYLKPNNPELHHLELAIKHKNNSFVFLNPKRKYSFAYDLVNININKYSKADKTFIYGSESYCPELLNLNIRWTHNKDYYKPNVFISCNDNYIMNAEQARSSLYKNKNDFSFLYNINTLRIIFVDFKNSYEHTSKTYSMFNNVVDATQKYRWLEWTNDNLSKVNTKDKMWILKKARYDNQKMYWLISYLNNDYLWVQQKGENWGFYFLASKNSNPLKSACLFFLNENTIK